MDTGFFTLFYSGKFEIFLNYLSYRNIRLLNYKCNTIRRHLMNRHKLGKFGFNDAVLVLENALTALKKL